MFLRLYTIIRLKVVCQIVVSVEVVHVFVLIAILAQFFSLMELFICIWITKYLDRYRLDALTHVYLHLVWLTLVLRNFVEVQVSDWLLAIAQFVKGHLEVNRLITA